MTFIQFADEPSQEERIAKLRAEIEKLGGSTKSLESMPAGRRGFFSLPPLARCVSRSSQPDARQALGLAEFVAGLLSIADRDLLVPRCG